MIKSKRKVTADSLEKQKYNYTMKTGRPSRFKNPKQFLSECCEYFQWANDNPWIKKEAVKSGDNAGMIIDIPTQRPYTIAGLCLRLGVNQSTFYEYEKQKEYSEVVAYVRGQIDNQQFEGASVGAFNPNLIARRLGLMEKQEHTIVAEQPLFPDVD